MIKGIDHIGVAVKSIEGSLPFYEKVLGLSLLKVEKVEEQGVKVFVTSGEKHVNLSEMLEIVGEHSVSSLLIEGGGQVNASFIEQKLINKLELYIAPKIVGGKEAPTFVEGKGIEKMSDALEFTNVTVIQLGKDYKFSAYPIYE